MNKEIKIAILGFGVVGSSVYQILKEKNTLFQERCGKKLIVTKILEKDLAKKSQAKEVTFTTNYDEIINDSEIKIVVETLGGEHPAYEFISKALKNKKYVITSNKEVFSKYKVEFIKLAKKHKVDIFYEASVGGSIPIIRNLKVGYAPNQINAIYGILNGTTNYILTKIEENNLEFNIALKDAQKAGFAEANPSMDISGLDSAYKLTILALTAFKKDISVKDIHFKGIESISLKDINYAKELGYKIKLLAIGKKEDHDRYYFSVEPMMIPLKHALSAVREENNAIYIIGDEIDSAMLYGKGAGGRPTGSAIISDILDIAFNFPKNSKRNLETKINKAKLIDEIKEKDQFYLRLLVKDNFGVLEKIAKAFGQNKVSLSRVIQKDLVADQAEIVILTHQVKELFLNRAVEGLSKIKEVEKIAAVIKVGLI